MQVQPYQQGYNVADYLLEVASDPPVGLFGSRVAIEPNTSEKPGRVSNDSSDEKGRMEKAGKRNTSGTPYAATFLTQLQTLSGREWKLLRRFICFIRLASLFDIVITGTRRYSLHMCVLQRSWACSAVSLFVFSVYLTLIRNRRALLPDRPFHRWIPITRGMSILPCKLDHAIK